MAKLSFTSAQDYVSAIESSFLRNADPDRAVGAKAYMRNQFEFLGISTPNRRAIQKRFFNAHEIPPLSQLDKIVKLLWNKPYRELQYFAMELAQKYRKHFTEKNIHLFEYMITHKSWWDTVDVVAPKLVAALFTTHPELMEPNVRRWIKSDNLWLKRSSLLFQLLYKSKTNEPLLFELILTSANHNDFFVQKAIGWALRQYARTNPKVVKKFALANKEKLSSLSFREAVKHL